MKADNLSKRLLKVASYIKRYGQKPIQFADIGTDHAYLPVYLVKNKIINKSVAGEVVTGPFESALSEIQAHNLSDLIQARLGDGLEIIQAEDEINAIAICGMGGKLICDILDGNRSGLVSGHILVLQPNNGARFVRNWLMNQGYQILDEDIILENGHYYEVIVAKDCLKDELIKLSAEDILFGPLNRQKKTEIFRNMWQANLGHLQKILANIYHSQEPNYGRIKEIHDEIGFILKELDMKDNQTCTLKDLTTWLDKKYPQDLAEGWDQVGLHFGRLSQPIKRVMTALDVNLEVVREAIDNDIDTIIVHHPPIFEPIHRFNLDIARIALFEQIIKHDLNVYAIHTNLDIAWDGMNDWLADKLNLKDVRSLSMGQGQLEPQLGRIGLFEKPLSRTELIQYIKENFELDRVNIIEKIQKSTYQKVAIVGGAGSSLLENVYRDQPDVFITGDITYHKGQEAENYPFMTMDCGHYIEAIFIQEMADRIYHASQDYGWNLEVIPSQVSTNPFKTL